MSCVRLSVHSPSDHGFQQARKMRGKKKKIRKRQPCTYNVCVTKEMHSVKHLLLLTLEAWAHLKECVLDFIYPFSYTAV